MEFMVTIHSSVVVKIKQSQVKWILDISTINLRAVKMIQILWNKGNNSITMYSASILFTQLVHSHLSKFHLVLQLRIPIVLDLTLWILRHSIKLLLLGKNHLLISLILHHNSSCRSHSSSSNSSKILFLLNLHNILTKHI